MSKELFPTDGAQKTSLVGLAKLQSMMSPGRNQLTDNPALESAYLEYQAEILDAAHQGNPGYTSISQLSEHERTQIGAMTTRLVSDGGPSADVLSNRLARIRILQDDAQSAFLATRNREGEFSNGLAVMKRYADPCIENHVKLHEVAHGLEAVVVIVDNGSSITDFQGGITSATLDVQDMDLATLQVLTNLREAMVDELALTASDIDKETYLAGKIPLGYSRYVKALAEMESQEPELTNDARRANFSEGLQSRRRGEQYAAAFMSAILDIELSGY